MLDLYPSRVKVCGITTVDDALAAADAGVKTLGFIFHPPSPRYLSVEQARRIVDALPAGMVTFGVFVDRPREEVTRMAAQIGLTALQVQGNESNAYLSALGLPVVKGLRIRSAEDLARIADYADANAILLDAWSPTAPGGTGLTCDWGALASADLGAKPIVLAGGLDSDNIARAIDLVRPFAVDISSGVETRPGIKDHAKLRAFAQAAARAFESLSVRRQQ